MYDESIGVNDVCYKMEGSSDACKLELMSQCFEDLSCVLTKILNCNVLDDGISGVRSDTDIPNEYVDEVTGIKHRLLLVGGKCRSRTRKTNNLKSVCDLWRRLGEEIIPENQSIGMTVKKITVGRRINNKRIQMNTYSYNWLNNESVRI